MRPLLLVVTGLLAAVLLPVSPGSAAGETCQGQAATIVGAPGQNLLTGTEGDDVVVTNSADRTETLGGNDLVCVTGGSAQFYHFSLDAGPGDDVIDASAANAAVRAVLGAGSDHYTGSPFDDDVKAGTRVDSEPDVIFTGTGSDTVDSGTPNSPNGDVVVLGGDGGSLGGNVIWSGPMAPGARLDGGVPGNTLDVGVGAGSVVVDAVEGTLTKEDRRVLTWTNFDDFSFYSRSAPSTFRFTGSDRDESVDLYFRKAHKGRQRIDLGGGDDGLSLGYSNTVGARGSSYAGGPGEDYAALWGGKSLRIDLASGRMETKRKGRTVRATFTGFDTHLVGARNFTMKGTKGDDVIRFYACQVTVKGRAGNDDIEQSRGDDYFEAGLRCNPAKFRIFGNQGDDRIRGGEGNDLLIGGPGYDTIGGGRGRDRCSAEKMKNCEIKKR